MAKEIGWTTGDPTEECYYYMREIGGPVTMVCVHTRPYHYVEWLGSGAACSVRDLPPAIEWLRVPHHEELEQLFSLREQHERLRSKIGDMTEGSMIFAVDGEELSTLKQDFERGQVLYPDHLMACIRNSHWEERFVAATRRHYEMFFCAVSDALDAEEGEDALLP